jgi:two-component system chemotaxis response regulator CheY
MKRILIADDSKVARDIAKRMFSQAFPSETFEFDEASDGGELYSKAAAGGNWALIATDWNMPDMTGIEVLRRLKTEGKLKDLPPVGFMTTESTPEMEAAAGQIPTSFFFIRPYTPERFKTTFGAILDKKP